MLQIPLFTIRENGPVKESEECAAMSQAISEASDFIIRICGQLSAALQILYEKDIHVRLDSSDMDTNVVDILADLHEIKIYLDSTAEYAKVKESANN